MVVIDGYTFANGVPVIESNNDDSYLADLTPIGGIRRAIRGNSQNIILKKTSLPEFSHPFIVKDGYCIGVCNGCSLASSCERSVIVKHSRLLAVTFDISSQEPLIASFVHKVPTWQKVFRNLNLRKLGLDWFLNLIASSLFYIDIDNDKPYWEFLADIENDRDDFLRLCEDSFILKSSTDESHIRDVYTYWASRLSSSLS